jgi:4-amino-4-deoxy-L-arabinose transferase-like glycosyltransferase
MLEGDTLWYHASFAVRLVQEGRLDILPAVGPEAQSFFPINTQLLHAIALLPFDRDLLAPAVNLVFFAMGLMAAWCLGRARGLGPLCLLAGAVVMALPTLAGTHPGQATNDVACAAFVLAAVALVVEGGVRAAPVGIAAVAGGLAIGTKLTVGPAVGMLVLGVVVLAIRDRRWWTALTACVAVVVASAYWFVRNWALIDTPLPWLDIRLGPIQLHQTVSLPKKGAITEYLTDTSVWTDIWAPGLERTLGVLWPLVLLGVLAGMALAIAPRRTGLERLAGLVAVAATFSYLVTPYTMGFGGALFVDTVRYGAPMLLIGFVLMPLGVCADLLGVLGRRIVAGVLALLLVVNALAPADARVEPWGPHALWAGLLAFAVVAAIGLARVFGPDRLPRVDARRLAVAGAAVLVLVVAVGWLGQRSYLSRRYVDAGLALDATNARLRDGGDGRVAVVGTLQYYPLFGADFSNRLVVPDPPSKRGSTADQCARWRRTLTRTGADYLVFGPDTFLTSVAEWEWFASDPNVEVVASDSDRTGLLRITGPLDPAGCAEAA